MTKDKANDFSNVTGVDLGEDCGGEVTSLLRFFVFAFKICLPQQSVLTDWLKSPCIVKSRIVFVA